MLFSQSPRPLHRPPWQRARRCLLKGCERWFLPARSQCRYCSAACAQAARRWRHWRAQQKYRATSNGRRHRQEQARRYRRRPTPPPQPPLIQPAAPPTGPPPAPEGKRLAKKDKKDLGQACARPGCYVLFAVSSVYQPRQFCCSLCRRALRCVLDREARRRRRRRRGLRRPGRRPRPPPRAGQ